MKKQQRRKEEPYTTKHEWPVSGSYVERVDQVIQMSIKDNPTLDEEIRKNGYDRSVCRKCEMSEVTETGRKRYCDAIQRCSDGVGVPVEFKKSQGEVAWCDAVRYSEIDLVRRGARDDFTPFEIVIKKIWCHEIRFEEIREYLKSSVPDFSSSSYTAIDFLNDCVTAEANLRNGPILTSKEMEEDIPHHKYAKEPSVTVFFTIVGRNIKSYRVVDTKELIKLFQFDNPADQYFILKYFRKLRGDNLNNKGEKKDNTKNTGDNKEKKKHRIIGNNNQVSIPYNMLDDLPGTIKRISSPSSSTASDESPKADQVKSSPPGALLASSVPKVPSKKSNLPGKTPSPKNLNPRKTPTTSHI